MKALFVSVGPLCSTGGISQHNRDYIAAMRTHFDEGVVVVSHADDRSEDGELGDGIRFHACGGGRARAILLACWQVLTTRPDLVVIGHANLAIIAFLIRILSPRTPMHLLVYGYEVWGGAYLRKAPELEKWVSRWAYRKIVSISQLSIDRMVNAYGTNPENYVIIPCAVDPGPAPAVENYSSEAGTLNLLTVCRLDLAERGKGCGRVLEAMARLPDDLDVTYTLIGEGSLRPELEQMTKDLQLEDRVSFAGRVSNEDRDLAYQDCDVFIMPSNKEGFGIVYLEAWGFAKPVVTGSEDAGAELVMDRECGISVDPNNLDAVVEAITYFARNPKERVEMGLAGRGRLEERYGFDSLCRHIGSLMETL